MAERDDIAKEERMLRMQRQQRHAGFHGIGGPVEKAKDFKGTLLRLISYMRKLFIPMIIAFIFVIISSLFNSYSPTIMRQLIDTVAEGVKAGSGHMDMAKIRSIILFLATLYGGFAVIELVQQFVMIYISQSLVFNMRQEIEEKLNTLPISFFDSHSRGDILSRVANDVENISHSLQMSLNQVISSVITVVSVLYFMLRMSWPLTLVSLVTVSLILLSTKFIAAAARKYFTEQWASTGDLNGHIEEMFTGHTIIKSFNQQQNAIDKFDRENVRLFHSSYHAAFISGIIMPMTQILNNLNYVVICIVGGVGIINGSFLGSPMTLGIITGMSTYSRQLMMPIQSVASLASTIQSTIASAERVFELLDEKPMDPDMEPIMGLENPKVIRFEHVKFSYDENKPLITDLSIEVKPGEKVAIVGPTGAGKTTLVNLLMRFYDVNGGRITIDGVDIRQIPRDVLRSQIGMVLQDVWLYSGSIRDNIAYGYNSVNGEEATEEQIIAAAKAAYVDHFVSTMGDGYDAMINDDATNISQGQRQLLTIARAFLSNPNILILDEATSSVDTRTEVMIQNAMQSLMQGRTSFIIAHRLSTIRDADVILVMKDGDIIESGNHTELLEKNGFYAELYNSQFIGAAIDEETLNAVESDDDEFGGFGGMRGMRGMRGGMGGGFGGGMGGGMGGGFPGGGMGGGFRPGRMPRGFDPSKFKDFDPSKFKDFDPSKFKDFDPSKFKDFDPSKVDPSKMPKDFDPGKFDPSKMPKDFDPGKFDPSKMPKDFDPGKFDPSKMPKGFDPSKFDPSKMPENSDPEQKD